MPHQVVERRPAEERTDDARIVNCHAQFGVHIRPQRHTRAIPQLDRETGLEHIGQPGQDFPRRSELFLGRSEQLEHGGSL
jgi:hypothetical protein